MRLAWLRRMSSSALTHLPSSSAASAKHAKRQDHFEPCPNQQSTFAFVVSSICRAQQHWHFNFACRPSLRYSVCFAVNCCCSLRHALTDTVMVSQHASGLVSVMCDANVIGDTAAKVSGICSEHALKLQQALLCHQEPAIVLATGCWFMSQADMP